MCGRYYVEADDMTLEIMQVIEEINRKKLNKHTGKDVVPTDYAPVITRQGITAMQWGFTLPYRKVRASMPAAKQRQISPCFHLPCSIAAACSQPAAITSGISSGTSTPSATVSHSTWLAYSDRRMIISPGSAS